MAVVDGRKLRALRKRLNLKIHQVAKGIDRSQAFVSYLERGLMGSPDDLMAYRDFLRAQAAPFPVQNAQPRKGNGATR